MKKMVLVDPAHMLLKTSPVPDTLSESVLSLDDEIKRVLESSSLNEHDKALTYEQVLHKYLKRVDRVNSRHLQKPSFPTNHSATVTQQESLENGTGEKKVKLEKRVVDSLPKTLQRKGGVLLEHIKDTADMTWNERGELIVKGQTLSGSNVSDLIHELLRTRKLGHEPKGWPAFANALKESNIPTDLIGNKARWESTTEPELAKSPNPQSLTTPTSRRRKRRKSLKGSKVKSPDWLLW